MNFLTLCLISGLIVYLRNGRFFKRRAIKHARVYDPYFKYQQVLESMSPRIASMTSKEQETELESSYNEHLRYLEELLGTLPSTDFYYSRLAADISELAKWLEVYSHAIHIDRSRIDAVKAVNEIHKIQTSPFYREASFETIPYLLDRRINVLEIVLGFKT
ncbi:MAG: hypothetical protein KGO49_11490 [Gammaproteobacteria bacterium]|nr:hypothetical protein [Gammaproteobacteria bacterium]